MRNRVYSSAYLAFSYATIKQLYRYLRRCGCSRRSSELRAPLLESKLTPLIRSKLYEGRASGTPHVKLEVYSPPDLSRPTFKDATSKDFIPTNVGASFGPSWSTHWFRVTLTIPSSLAQHSHLEFHWDANNEGLIWTEHGHPVHGLTGGGERTEWILPEEWKDGKDHVFYIEMACNGMFGNAPGGDTIQPPKPDKYFQLTKADIVAVNLEARALSIDFWIIGGVFFSQ